MSPLNVAICTTTYLERQQCYGPGKKILFKNNYLTLRSKVKVPRRSLRYATHRLMVMHQHTKYHSPISKDKNVMARTRKYYLKNNYLTLFNYFNNIVPISIEYILFGCNVISEELNTLLFKSVQKFIRQTCRFNNYYPQP